jgi:pantetheine-phosphate adenylyltransferase
MSEKKVESKKEDAVFAFSGDPITFGHINVIERVRENYDRFVVALGINGDKKYMFNLKEREMFANKALEHLDVEVMSYEGLLVDFAYKNGLGTIVRGYRNEKDIEYESTFREISQKLGTGINFEYVKAAEEMKHFSSSIAKAMVSGQGCAHEIVPAHVKESLESRILGIYPYAMTGSIAMGKSWMTDKLIRIANEQGFEAHNIDLDKIGHKILQAGSHYQIARDQMAQTFGESIMLPDGSISRKILGDIVFGDKSQLAKLDEIMIAPLLCEQRQERIHKQGILFINGALIAEAGLSYLSNFNVGIVDGDEVSQYTRLSERTNPDGTHLTDEQIIRRINSQYTNPHKIEIFKNEIENVGHGKLCVIENSIGTSEQSYYQVFDKIVKQLDRQGELRFKALWNRVGGNGTPDEAYKKILATYLSNDRHYHDIHHIVGGYDLHQEFRDQLESPEQVLWAWTFHDYVKEYFSKVDEERSADEAYKIAKYALLPDDFAQGVKELVMPTKHDKIPGGIDARFMVDMDLMIFGMPEPVFDRYDLIDVRREFANVPEGEFREGRKSVLESFNSRGKIYLTDFVAKRYETQARTNLKRAIDRLS